MLKEFKEFAIKGNVVDLAVGVVIGGAFQKIVTSLVEDIIMPAISIFTGKIDFSDMVLTVGNSSIKYGNFITAIVNFLIIAFSIFLIVRYINKLNKKEAQKLKDFSESLIDKIDKKGVIKAKRIEKEKKNKKETIPETKLCPYCLTEVKYKATRCPHCTSELPDLSKLIENETKTGPQENSENNSSKIKNESKD